MIFKLDRNLNYGRHIIKEFSSTLQGIFDCLDIGAGSGLDLDTIKLTHPDARLHAVESWEPNVRLLETKGVKVTSMNFESGELPFENSSFDLIVSNQVIEHTKEIFWTMHEITRTLKPGGYLLIGVPNLASLHNRFLLMFGRQPTCIQNSSAHIRGFTSRDLKQFIDIFPEGYELVKYAGSNFYPFSPILAKPLARLLPSMAWSNFFLFKKVNEYTQAFYIEYPLKMKLETNFKCSSDLVTCRNDN